MIRYAPCYFILSLFFIGFFFLTACPGKPTESELYVQKLEQRVKEEPENDRLLLELMLGYLNAGQPLKTIELYTAHKERFKADVTAQCYYGAAYCLRAAAIEALEEKMLWIKKGMIILDNLVANYPQNKDVFIWRGFTYSHFPVLLGVRSLVESDFANCLSKHERKDWSLSAGDLSFIFSGYENVAWEYKDPLLLDSAYQRMRPLVPASASWLDKGYNDVKKRLGQAK